MYDLKSKLSQCTISLKARVASMGTEPESRSARSDLVYRARARGLGSEKSQPLSLLWEVNKDEPEFKDHKFQAALK